MLKKRLIAWLLVLCMTVTLMPPGTALAADDEVTITYDLNDGISYYQLQLTTKAGQVPENQPGAERLGRPFAGWSGDENGDTPPDYSKDSTVYAMWQNGYTVYLDFMQESWSDPENPPTGGTPEADRVKYTTDNTSMLKASDRRTIKNRIEEFEKKGTYLFAGWFTSTEFLEDERIDLETDKIPSNGVTLYARWTTVYNITFHFNDPIMDNPTLVDGNLATNPDATENVTIATGLDGKLSETIEKPVREGYSFTGWYYNLVADGDGTSTVKSTDIDAGELKAFRGTLLADPNTHTFDRGMDLYANWGAPYTVTFDASPGTFDGTPDGPYEEKVGTFVKGTGMRQENRYVLPSKEPLREGYTFVGWYKTPRPAAYKSYKEDDKAALNDENIDTPYLKDPEVPGSSLPVTTVSFAHSVSDSSYNPANPYDPDKNPDGIDAFTSIFYARWREGYKITFELYGDNKTLTVWTNIRGELPAAAQKLVKETMEQQTQIPGHVLIGWFLPDGEEVSYEKISGRKFTEATTIKGDWEEGHTIYFDSNGGKWTSGATTMDARTDEQSRLAVNKLPANPSRDGYTFLGWGKKEKGADGNEIITPYEKTPSGLTGQPDYYDFIDIFEPEGLDDAGNEKKPPTTYTLYAVWGAPFTVFYNYNDGTGKTSEDKAEAGSDGIVKYPLFPTPTRVGHIFRHWYEVNNNNIGDETKKFETEKTENGNTTAIEAKGPVKLMAKWDRIYVIFDTNSGGFTTGANTEVTRTLPVEEQDGRILLANWPTVTKTSTDNTGWYWNPEGNGTEITQGHQFTKEDYETYGWYYNGNPTVVLYAGWKDGTKDAHIVKGDNTTTTTAAAPSAFALPRPSLVAPMSDGPMAIAEGDEMVTVTFDPNYTYNDGILPDDKKVPSLTISKDSELTKDQLKDPPARTDGTHTDRYTFVGWYTEAIGGTKVEEGTKVTDTVTYYAHWEPGYKITFNLNCGDAAVDNPPSKEAWTNFDGTLGMKLPDISTFSRKGYTCVGWSTNSNATSIKDADGKITGVTEEVASTTPFNSATIIYAVWEPSNVFTITFHLNYENSGSPITRTTNEDGLLTELPTASRDNHSLIGWFTEPEGGNPLNIKQVFNASTGIYDFYAHWEPTITVVFHENHPDGSTSKDNTITGTKDEVYAQFPSSGPVFGGWQFLGWAESPSGGGFLTKDDVKTFSGKKELWAQWKEKEWTISFDPNASDGSVASIDPQTTSGGKLPNLPNPKRNGYLFLGWFTAKDNDKGEHVDQGYIFSGDITIYAHWQDLSQVKPENPVVHFIVDTDPIFEEKNAAHFTMVTDPKGLLKQVPKLIKLGIETNGWRDENYEPVDTSYNYSADDTYIYVNQATRFEITFDWCYEDEYGLPVTEVIRTGVNGKIEKWPDTEGKRDESNFDDWYTEREGGTPVPRGRVFDADTTIYAHWKSPYKITFDANGGQFSDGEPKSEKWTDDDGYFAGESLPETPTREGYKTFGGWAETADGTTPVAPVTWKRPYPGPTTFYAIWKGPFGITYDAKGGTLGELTEEQKWTDDEGKYQSLPEPTHERDTFAGWYTTEDYSGEPVSVGDVITGPVTLYAKWRRDPPYTITFDPTEGYMSVRDLENDTSGNNHPKSELKTDDKGVLLTVPADPVKRSGTFLGWYTTKEVGTGEKVEVEDLKTKVFEDDITLYAQWSSMEFTITFDFNLKTRPDMEDPFEVTTTAKTQDRKLAYLPNLNLPQAASGAYEVEAWYRVPNPGPDDEPVDKLKTEFTRDTTLYAKWKKADKVPVDFKYANITFMNEDGTEAMITLEVGINNKMEKYPEPPYKSGESFVGWFTHNPDGTEKEQLSKGTTPVDPDYLITGSIVAYPKYRWKTAIVTFDPGLGEVEPKTANTSKDGTLTEAQMPTPVWPGHTFLGWFTREDEEGVEINKRTVFTEDTTVYAHWKDGEPTPPVPDEGYTITFDPNGGTVKYTSLQTNKDGILQSYPDPVREGYTFEGWYHGDTKVDESTVYTENTTIVAHWKKLPDEVTSPTSPPYTITFNPDGGNLGGQANTALTDLDGRLTGLPQVTRTGYKFDGWYKESERVTTATVFTSNTTVTAHWSTATAGGSNNGSNDGSGAAEGYSIVVSATEGGRVTASKTYALANDRITMTVRPNTGYMLESVYVTNSRGRDVELYDQGGSRYTFYMPDSRVTIEATFIALTVSDASAGINGNLGNYGNIGNTGTNGNTNGTAWIPGSSTSGTTNWYPGGVSGTMGTTDSSTGLGVFSAPVLNTLPMPYTDVRPSDWYYGSVDYLWKRSLMGGVSATQFGPNATTSNAMIWTILARLAGVDVTTGASVWYENARSWAVSNNISDGADPNAPVTREQLASMLWRYKGSPSSGYDLGQFSDRGLVSTYQAESALRWAASNNIVTGSNGRLNPRGTATRAEVAAMITRFCQNT